MPSLLEQVRIVLVQSSHPGNIGAAARAMKTMGLRRLYLVQPADFPSAAATARAAGADDLLATAWVGDCLEEAVRECHCVMAVSARRRSIPWQELTPADAAGQLLRAASAGPVALVFGPESSGLGNREIERCQAMIRIPAHPDFCSLNLAAAVQLVCYELWQASGGAAAIAADQAGSGGGTPPSFEEMEHFYRHLEQCMVQVEFLDPQNPRRLMSRLRRLFTRAGLARSELNILRGFLTCIDHGTKPGSGERILPPTGEPSPADQEK